MTAKSLGVVIGYVTLLYGSKSYIVFLQRMKSLEVTRRPFYRMLRISWTQSANNADVLSKMGIIKDTNTSNQKESF